jgi:hypothetical protein
MINRSKEKRQMDMLKLCNYEKEFFNKINPDFKVGLSNLTVLLEKITKEILKKNKEKNNEINLVKSIKPIQSNNPSTPIQIKGSIMSKSSVNLEKWKESIRLVLESSYNACIYFLERNLKKIKYPDSVEQDKVSLISAINKILQKDNYSKDINVK